MGGEPPTAEVAHAMPGRVRLRIPGRRGDAVFFASVASGLSSLPGVYKVDVAPLTGSVLIRHGGPLEKLSAAAQNAGLFALGETAAKPISGTRFEFDPKTAVALALAVAALRQLSREKVLPPALTLLWYASHLGGFWRNGGAEDGE